MSISSAAISHPTFFNRYVEQVGEGEINALLKQSLVELSKDLSKIRLSEFSFSYQPQKWSIETLLRHCIDAELIFCYRALTIARKDKNIINSFEENEFAIESGIGYDKDALIEEFINARKSSVLLYKSFKEEWMNRTGKTENGDNLSLLSQGYIIIGHWLHHKKILEDRYDIKF